MELHENWGEVEALFRDSFKSSFHYAVATVGEDGQPHITPIGSLILGEPGRGFYFEKFARQLPANIANNRRICVLAVNSSLWFWLKSLLLGRFGRLPAVRLYGVANELRKADERELAQWRRRVRRVRFSRGYRLMWRDMSMVREIEFDRIEPVTVGAMTRGLW
jgi:hypothetical protein